MKITKINIEILIIFLIFLMSCNHNSNKEDVIINNNNFYSKKFSISPTEDGYDLKIKNPFGKDEQNYHLSKNGDGIKIPVSNVI